MQRAALPGDRFGGTPIGFADGGYRFWVGPYRFLVVVLRVAHVLNCDGTSLHGSSSVDLCATTSARLFASQEREGLSGRTQTPTGAALDPLIGLCLAFEKSICRAYVEP